MLNCKEASRLMSEAQERELALNERLSLVMHTGMCAACRRFGQQVLLLRKISRHYVKQQNDHKQDNENE